jgi:hypothetical protein
LTAFFAKSVGQTLLGRKANTQPELPDAVRHPASALKNVEASGSEHEGLPANEFLPARRYGNE